MGAKNKKKGWIKGIMDQLISLQERLMPEAQAYVEEGMTQRTSLLRVVGLDGENILLQYNRGKISYAPATDKNNTPYHIFKCSSDTFLSLLAGDTTMREAITKKQFVIERSSTKTIDVVECERWATGFSNLGGFMRQLLGITK